MGKGNSNYYYSYCIRIPFLFTYSNRLVYASVNEILLCVKSLWKYLPTSLFLLAWLLFYKFLFVCTSSYFCVQVLFLTTVFTNPKTTHLPHFTQKESINFHCLKLSIMCFLYMYQELQCSHRVTDSMFSLQGVSCGRLFSDRVTLDKASSLFKCEMSLLVELCHDVKIFAHGLYSEPFTFFYSKKQDLFLY